MRIALWLSSPLIHEDDDEGDSNGDGDCDDDRKLGTVCCCFKTLN